MEEADQENLTKIGDVKFGSQEDMWNISVYSDCAEIPGVDVIIWERDFVHWFKVHVLNIPNTNPFLVCIVASQPGTQRQDSVPEVGEDAVNTAGPSASSTALTEEEQAELHSELAKVEDEIQTLTQVLAAKEKQMAEIKRTLGINPLNELKQNLSKSWHEVTTSTAYKKTSETLSQVGQKATTAFSSMGSAITRKLEDVRLQSFSNSFGNTPTFKSFEEKVDTLKTKMSPTPSTGDIDEVSDFTPNEEPVVKQPEGTITPDQEPH